MKLDQSGQFSVTASGGDPSTAAVLSKRIAQLSGLLGTPAAKVYTTFASGIVDKYVTGFDVDTGEITFTFSGDDLLSELANTSVLNTELSNGAGGPTTIVAALALIAAFVPTWTFDVTTYASTGTTTNTSTSVTGVTNVENFSIGGPIVGTGIPAGATVANIVGTTITLSAAATASATVALSGATIYLKFAGESVLTALTKVAAAAGHHFRLGTDRQVVWLFKVQPSSGLRIISAGDSSLINNDEVALIQKSLEVTSDTHDIVTRLYPFGGGNAAARKTLNNATVAAPSGYTRHIDADPNKSYIQHDAAVALYGVIERVMNFKDASPAGTAATATETASTGNQIQSQAVEFLRTHSGPLKTYRFSLVKLDRAVYPGQTVRLIFRRTVDGYRAIDEDVTLVVLDSTLNWDTNGNVRTTNMTVATTDRRPTTAVGTLVGAMSTIASLDNHVQVAERSLTADTATGVTGVTVTSGKTLTVNNSMTLAGTSDSFTLTVPATGTVDLLGTAQTISALKTLTGGLFVNSFLRLKVVNVTGSVTAGTTNVIINVTNTAAPRTITLPDAATAGVGWVLIVKDATGGAAAQPITVARAGSNTIDGATSVVINTNFGVARIYSDGTQFYTF